MDLTGAAACRPGQGYHPECLLEVPAMIFDHSVRPGRVPLSMLRVRTVVFVLTRPTGTPHAARSAIGRGGTPFFFAAEGWPEFSGSWKELKSLLLVEGQCTELVTL